MHITEGRVAEIRLEHPGNTSAKIAISEQAGIGVIPDPGQYLMAWKPTEPDAPLAVPLFSAESCTESFWTASPVPGNWVPGDILQLRGPIGHGFRFPPKRKVHRLAMAALGGEITRLLPLAVRAIQDNMSVTLFTISSSGSLPAELEIYPLSDLPEALNWADFLTLDLTPDQLSGLRKTLGVNPGMHLPCPGQALIFTEMPCGALAGCGACAVRGADNWLFVCQDGPVFDLNELDW
jgi:NAD(P)H-flavin reductase